jgi:hypothetical protein
VRRQLARSYALRAIAAIGSSLSRCAVLWIRCWWIRRLSIRPGSSPPPGRVDLGDFPSRQWRFRARTVCGPVLHRVFPRSEPRGHRRTTKSIHAQTLQIVFDLRRPIAALHIALRPSRVPAFCVSRNGISSLLRNIRRISTFSTGVNFERGLGAMVSMAVGVDVDLAPH